MDMHLSERRIQALGCETIFHFSSEEAYKGPVVATDGLMRVYHAISAHIVCGDVLVSWGTPPPKLRPMK